MEHEQPQAEDLSLHERLRGGDPLAFESLYRRYSAESEIKYDITPDPLPEEKTKEVREPAKTGPAKAEPAKVDCKDPKNAKDPACKPSRQR